MITKERERYCFRRRACPDGKPASIRRPLAPYRAAQQTAEPPAFFVVLDARVGGEHADIRKRCQRKVLDLDAEMGRKAGEGIALAVAVNRARAAEFKKPWQQQFTKLLRGIRVCRHGEFGFRDSRDGL